MSASSVPVFLIDAFSEQPFSGNPAAVVLLNEAADPRWMQKVAAEFNLSETAFAWRESVGYRLRWFTPTVEISLCGHATLATAHAIWSQSPGARAPLEFETMSGRLVARPQGQEWIELDFPILRTRPERPEPEVLSGMLEALGLSAPPVDIHHCKLGWIFELSSESSVRELKPELSKLRKNVIVTARADAGSGRDFVSRVFVPEEGIPEDPVTGAAHCALGPYWSTKLGGKTEFTAYQASARGGSLRVTLTRDRALLAGRATRVMSGSLMALGDG